MLIISDYLRSKNKKWCKPKKRLYCVVVVGVLVAPQPYNLSPVEDFDFNTDMDLTGGELLWYARPQLFFHCTVCPTGSLGRQSQHKELALVFVSTFESITVSPNAIMQHNGVPMFYDTASSPNLLAQYICWAKNVLGRVPLMPCFVSANGTLHLLHRFGGYQGGLAESSTGAGNDSRLYELNTWRWRYGRGQPRMSTAAEAEKQLKASDANACTGKRAAETLKHSRILYYFSRSQEASAESVSESD